ncbi:uncharacterized protein BCR38DRAFT_415140 [Pseudomassariella vexata]|uniref:TEA domain-containing protein n=1 Tax=Pseudomassariella vexata TaxID=1141098 RepID=A0A1Y2D6W2_9PEZI|nr:uncharacterized protein BCR38DRAFT_415140 [Pseudomassariella vexata]ORY54806.1 hypothetical protein BCR38DRAFT_415140 [Pseudomassariella vexata]
MEHPRRVLANQRYSPEGDYTYDHHNELIQATRQPLHESNGNAQPHNVAALALYHGQLGLSPPLHSTPTPPILPGQVTSTYGTSLGRGRSFHRDLSLRESPMGHPRGGRNPIYSWKHFADYRMKMTQKESENEEPTWPLYLEDAFLDALLLIPLMGRKKFSSKGVLYGRNMLLTEYLWIVHWLLFPAGPSEKVPTGKAREKHKMYRTRKQVSSHIQVLKGFFSSHPVFHFFFPRKADEEKEDRRSIKEEEGETESFKNNRVLIALAEGRLPDERPNYEYFSLLLHGDSEVFVRPKTCWIYISSSEVTLSDDSRKAYAADGACLDSDAYTVDGQRLECKGDYPHLVLNSNKDTRRELNSSKDTHKSNILLHEYTHTLSQKESGSTRDISSKWDQRFPELREKLMAALDNTDPSHESTSRCVVGPCDTLQFEVVLDLHATSQFPPGTHLNGVVLLSICRPELANHNWKSRTSVCKPAELDSENSDLSFWDRTADCEVSGRGNARDTIEVPFPAISWADMLMKLAPCVTADRQRAKEERPHKMKGIKEEDCEPPLSSRTQTPTAKDLLQQVAMYQEIWSTPNNGSNNCEEKRRWTRRAVILWTFCNVHTKVDDKGKVHTVPPGTNWRFLTKLDPQSQYHQQRAYLSGSPNISRSNIMSPDPGYAHHLSATMHDNFSAAYDTPNMTQAHLASMTNTGMGILNSYPDGLATPPPTACLPASASYAHSFDSATIASNDSFQPHHHLGFLSNTSASDSQSTLVTDHGPDPFLSGLGVPVNSFDDTDCDANLRGWVVSSGLDASQWSTSYVDTQQSLAWAADPTAVEIGNGTSGDIAETQWHTAAAPQHHPHHNAGTNAPWSDGKDKLWTTTPNTAKTTTHGDWQTTFQPWLQAVAVVAEGQTQTHAHTQNNNNINQNHGWDDLGSAAQPENSVDTSSYLTASPSSAAATSSSSLTPMKQHHQPPQGRKRSRGDDYDDGGRS